MVCLREVDTIKAHTLEVFIQKKKKRQKTTQRYLVTIPN